MAYGIWRTGTSFVTKKIRPPCSRRGTPHVTSAERKKFDKTICVYAIRALIGRATKKTLSPDGTTTYSSWSNEKMRRYWRLPTAHTEARVRRLRWAQELSRRPQTHCQVLAAMFGNSPFGETRASPEGRIIRPVGPWAMRINRGHRNHCRHRRRSRRFLTGTGQEMAPLVL